MAHADGTRRKRGLSNVGERECGIVCKSACVPLTIWGVPGPREVAAADRVVRRFPGLSVKHVLAACLTCPGSWPWPVQCLR